MKPALHYSFASMLPGLSAECDRLVCGGMNGAL